MIPESNNKHQPSTSSDRARAWGEPPLIQVVQGLLKTEVSVGTVIITFKHLKPHTKPMKITGKMKSCGSLRITIVTKTLKHSSTSKQIDSTSYTNGLEKEKECPVPSESIIYLSLHCSFTYYVYDSIKMTRHTHTERKYHAARR